MTKTLFGRTALIITSTMLVFLIAVITIVGYFIILPVGKRNATDLSELILLSAQTYVELPPKTRQDFINELSKTHRLHWGSGNEPLAKHIHLKPHFYVMEQHLSDRLGFAIDIAPQSDNSDRYWADIKISDEVVRIGFDQQRIGAAALPYVSLSLLFVLSVATLLSSLILVRKLTRPINDLSKAANIIGQGGLPEPLIESGPKELSETIKAFNKMSTDVQALLENRTVLLGGISHDLRTPLTRLNLALEMLPQNVDDELRHEIKDSVKHMETIIQEYMQLTKGLEDVTVESVNIDKLVNKVISEINVKNNQKIILDGSANCIQKIHTAALHRVLFNLIENAVFYGNQKPVKISWVCSESNLKITIKDQGSGIPKQQQDAIFRPFYRLESSRSRNTGGSGLGLAIVEQIVKNSNWKLTIRSDANSGTQITLLI